MNDTIVWTLLPYGTGTAAAQRPLGKAGRGGPAVHPPASAITGPVLKLSILVSPRLYMSGTQLSQHATWRHWTQDTLPTLLSKSPPFSVVFTASGTPTTVPAQVITFPAPDASLWEALFEDTTPVTPYQFSDYSQQFIQSHPMRDNLSVLKALHQSVVRNAPKGLPPGVSQLDITTLLDQINQGWRVNEPSSTGIDATTPMLARELTYYKSLFRRTVGAGGTTGYNAFPPPSVNSSTPAPLYQLRFFHYRPPLPVGTAPAAPALPAPDFHQAVSALTKYPTLLRKLGLVIDIEVSASGVASGVAGSTVQLVAPFGADDVTPQTFYSYDGSTVFTATSTTGKVQDGMLNLSDSSTFDLMQVDVDGGATKVVNNVLSLELKQSQQAVPNDSGGGSHQAAGTSQSTGLPSLRTSGLVVTEYARAFNLAQALPTAASNNTAFESGTGSGVTFSAEDLLRGYRVDIFDTTTSTWYSLCRRAPAIDPSTGSPYSGSYYFPTLSPNQYVNAVDANGEDEGLVSLAATEDPNSTDTPPDLYLHEALVHWNGWSLVAQRPGKNVGIQNPQDYSYYDPKANLASGLNLAALFAAKPGSLPLLRFGRSYRLRARAVDLAGNSLPYTSSATIGEIPGSSDPALTYRRFEPVPAPAVILRRSLLDDSQNPISTNQAPGESPERLVLRSDFDKTTAQYVTYLDTSPLTYTPFYADTQRHVAPPKTSELMAELHGMFDAGGLVNAYNTIVTLDGELNANLDANGQAHYDIDQLTLPYLPDPIARGVTFVGLPGTTAGTAFGTSYEFDSSGKWPGVLPFRIVVVEGSEGQAPSFDSTTNALTVYLPKGEAYTVQYSSHAAAGDLARLGMWEWLAELGPPSGPLTLAELDQLEHAAIDGLLWQLTPFRQLTLVHAVQRPLIQPQFQQLYAIKGYQEVGPNPGLGETFATIIDMTAMTIDGKSTIKVDVIADWQEPVDDPLSNDPTLYPSAVSGGTSTRQAGPVLIPGHAHVFETPVHENPIVQTATNPNAVGQHQFDTQITIEGKHQFGDTKRRHVDYTAVGTTRHREYLPFSDSQIISDNNPGGIVSLTQTSPAVGLDIYNSARPDAPKVLYVVPAFEWSTAQQPGKVVSQRLGGRLRVYLDRPWYSSGVGELLGVVLYETGSAVKTRSSKPQPGHRALQRAKHMLSTALQTATVVDVLTTLKPYVTQWGMDPIWAGQPLTMTLPAVQHFPLASASESGLILDELQAGPPVSVAGHAVGYDATFQRWYADIEIDWGDAYFPFVRLALARYQPLSVVGAELSRVVLADFVQLAPDRVATIQTHFVPGDPNRVSVSVFGIGAPGSTMNVSLQQQMPGIPGDPGWVPVPNTNHELDSQPSGNDTLWSVQFRLPRPAGSVPYRLIIQEFEPFVADGPPGSSNTTTVPAARLVYVNAVQI